MRALTGRRLVVTRAAEDAAAWRERIEAQGGQVRILPCVRASLRRDDTTRAQLERGLNGARWLVLTSPRALAAFDALGIDSLPATLSVAVVGASTAEATRAAGWRVDLVGESGAAALGQALAARIARASNRAALAPTTGEPVAILHACASHARAELAVELKRHGLGLSAIAVYDVVPVEAAQTPIVLSHADADAILLASPSAATGLVNIARVGAGVCVACLGDTTAARARELGLVVGATARRPTLDSLLEALP